MNGEKTKKLIIMGVLAITLAVSLIAFSVAWFQEKVVTPYSFVINANGVLYVYMDSEVVANEQPLIPAVAMPGAVSAGRYIDVLTEYDPASPNPSYVEKAASITQIKGNFTVFNEGYVYDPVALGKDENGYTLAPVLDDYGYIVWIDDSDHSKGYKTQRIPDSFDDDGNVTAWSKNTYYEPLVDENGRVVWSKFTSYDDYCKNGECPPIQTACTGWEKKSVLRDNSKSCKVTIHVAFKASADASLNDYFDSSSFVIRRLYLTTENEDIPEGTQLGKVYGNSGVPFDNQSDDKTTSSFEMFGSSEYYLHAEVYLAQPDQLLDPEIRGRNVYMTVSVSVEVSQYNP